jgi:hypothetical protein
MLSKAVVSSEVLTERSSVSKHSHMVVGRMKLPQVIELKTSVIHWLLARASLSIR